MTFISYRNVIQRFPDRRVAEQAGFLPEEFVPVQRAKERCVGSSGMRAPHSSIFKKNCTLSSGRSFVGYHKYFCRYPSAVWCSILKLCADVH